MPQITIYNATLHGYYHDQKASGKSTSRLLVDVDDVTFETLNKLKEATELYQTTLNAIAHKEVSSRVNRN